MRANTASMACLSPVYRNVKERWFPVPCGGCVSCRRRRTDAWVFRMLQEEKRSSSAHFITLTYDPDHVPISPNGFMTLDKGEFPRFMKRLRKLCPDSVLKYYACGEYGTDNKRPHYHAIIFNVPDVDMIFDAWHLGGQPFGRVDVGQVSDKSIAYTVAYASKHNWHPDHVRDDRIPEFSLMSKGLGSNYITPAVSAYHKADLSRIFLTKEGGDKIAMPRYYRERIFDEDERAAQSSIVELSIGEKNTANYKRYLRLYGESDSFTYSQYLQTQRDAAVNSFRSSIKSRNL